MSLLRERREHGVELLRINRPAKRNALDSATLRLLISALTELSGDPALRVLILSTTSVDAFCAGADVTEPRDAEAGVARMEAFAELYRCVEHLPVPTIAVCVDNCVGAGAEIVAGCDLRVAGDNLKLAWAGARLGVPVGPARLTQLVGLSRARRSREPQVGRRTAGVTARWFQQDNPPTNAASGLGSADPPRASPSTRSPRFARNRHPQLIAEGAPLDLGDQDSARTCRRGGRRRSNGDN